MVGIVLKTTAEITYSIKMETVKYAESNFIKIPSLQQFSSSHMPTDEGIGQAVLIGNSQGRECF
jgi:hypothetical protein